MPDTKISALTSAANAASANEIPINEAGTSKKLTVGQIESYINGNYSSGDAQQLYVATTAQLLALRKGSTVAPDTVSGPLLKVERTLAVTDTTLIATGDAVEPLSAISGIAVGTTAFTAQPVGVSGFAKNSGTSIGTEGRRPDACGVYGVGRITGSGIGVGIGAFFAGRRENDTGKITAVEMHVANYGTLAGSYNSTGFPGLGGVWMNCSGNADSGAGIVISNAFGRQFKVGIGFTAQVTGGLTGGVADSTIRDDSQSVTSLDIRGTHSGYGLDLQAGTFTTAPIRLPNMPTASGIAKGIVARNAANTANVGLLSLDEFDQIRLGAGSTVYVVGLLTATNNVSFPAVNGTKLGTAATQKMAFWNATPVAQPAGIIDADGTLADITTKFNALVAKFETIGLLAVA